MTGPIVAVVRVEHVPEPPIPTDQRECSDCGEPVWLAQSTIDAFRLMDRAYPVLVCNECLAEHLLREQ